MKNKSLKIMTAAFAVFFGALVASPAWAECSLCQPAHKGNLAKVQQKIADFVADGGIIGDLLEEKDDKNRTALFRAVAQDHTEVALYLLAQGAKVNVSNNSGRTPLMWAAQNGNEELVIALLAANPPADVNATRHDNGKTAMDTAVQNGHSGIVQLLANAGATMDCEIGQEFNPDTVACECEAGLVPDINGPGCTECDEPQTAVDGVCQCPEGYSQIGKICLPGPQVCLDMGEYYDKSVHDCRECGENQTPAEDGLSCVCEHESMELVNGECRCPEGYSQVGKICIPGPQVCLDMGEYYDKSVLDCRECGENQTPAEDGLSCVCADGYSWEGAISACAPTIAYCNEMDKIRNEEYQCESCGNGIDMELHPGGENSCVPTIAYCNSLGQIRNAEFMCEMCPDEFELHESENRCIPECGKTDKCPVDGDTPDPPGQCEIAGEHWFGEEFKCMNMSEVYYHIYRDAYGREEYQGFIEAYSEHGKDGMEHHDWLIPHLAWAAGLNPTKAMRNRAFYAITLSAARGAPVGAEDMGNNALGFLMMGLTSKRIGLNYDSVDARTADVVRTLRYFSENHQGMDVEGGSYGRTSGLTPLYYAVRYARSVEAAEILLDWGASCNIGNIHGRNPPNSEISQYISERCSPDDSQDLDSASDGGFVVRGLGGFRGGSDYSEQPIPDEDDPLLEQLNARMEALSQTP